MSTPNSKKVLNTAFGDRLLRFIQAKGHTVNSLSLLMKSSSGERVRQATQGTMPRVDMLQELKELYADLNLNWLIAGEGEMVVKSVASPPQEVGQLTDRLERMERIMAGINAGLAILTDEVKKK